jgi:large subunit ribosomal protein L10
MPNKKNQDIVQSLSATLKSSTAVWVCEYSGVSANSINKLRADVASLGGSTEVAKNTLMKIALQEAGIHNSDIDMFMKGQTVSIIATQDPFEMLKKLYAFSQENEKLLIKAGLLDHKVYTGAELEVLSKLPSKEVLISKIVGGLKSPLFGIVNVLSGPQKSLVYALSAIATKKEVA